MESNKQKITKIIPYDDLDVFIWGNKLLHESIEEQTRWSIWTKYVVEDEDGKCWEIYLETPATEYQEVERDDAEATLVEGHQVMTTKWRPVYEK